ncbi:MAG TPA: hypothetical protein VGO80_17105 [Solirubrobacteraceae bacterium]|jgi:tryptophanyl-tRNA synthetase|nr:hypothetical protein [Solirubrobacteraceae bacterium]
MGLHSYPVLIAADILALDADEMPAGADQVQHLDRREPRPAVFAEL